MKSQCAKVQAFLKRKSAAAHYLEGEEEADSSADELKYLGDQQINNLTYKPYEVEVTINNCRTKMEVDTGSPWSIVPASVF